MRQGNMGLAMAMIAAVLLLASGPTEAARRAFLGDLEASSLAASRTGGRRLQQDIDVDIFESADYDVIEVLASDYDPTIGAYGGYGVYGYYGSFYGVYGTYNGDLFVDYSSDITDDIIVAELETDEIEDLRRRSLLQHGEHGEHAMGTPMGKPAKGSMGGKPAKGSMGGKPAMPVKHRDMHHVIEVDAEDIGDLQLLDMPFIVSDFETDFAYTGTYGVYSGMAYGAYYGSMPVYGGYYGGGYGGADFVYDYDTYSDLLEAKMEAVDTLEQAVETAAHEDLMESIDDGELIAY